MHALKKNVLLHWAQRRHDPRDKNMEFIPFKDVVRWKQRSYDVITEKSYYDILEVLHVELTISLAICGKTRCICLNAFKQIHVAYPQIAELSPIVLPSVIKFPN